MLKYGNRIVMQDKTKIAIFTGLQWLGGFIWLALKVAGRAARRFNEEESTEAAAAIAYYTLFSLFPFLLLLLAVASSVLKNQELQASILDAVGDFLPTSQELVRNNIEQVLRLRSTVGAVGMIGLLWSATAVFSVLTHNISQAWCQARPRNYVKLKLMALTMVGSMVALLVLSQVLLTTQNLLIHFDVPGWGAVSIDESVLNRQFFLKWGSQISIFLAFWLMYWWGPNIKVRWLEALWGAVVATFGWELLKRVFIWYLASGFARQRLVYGSLGAVVALMLWVYLSSLVILFGAHISAAIGYYRMQKEQAAAPPQTGADALGNPARGN
jgi:membrane protein